MGIPSYIQTWVGAVAAVCHAVNRAYCQSQGDHSQPTWDNAPDWMRESAIKGVHYLVEHPDAGPSAQHDAWLEAKRADGWIYGPVKDPENKQHPCMVPYDDLPAAQKAKDYLFQAVVRSLVFGEETDA